MNTVIITKEQFDYILECDGCVTTASSGAYETPFNSLETESHHGSKKKKGRKRKQSHEDGSLSEKLNQHNQTYTTVGNSNHPQADKIYNTYHNKEDFRLDGEGKQVVIDADKLTYPFVISDEPEYNGKHDEYKTK